MKKVLCAALLLALLTGCAAPQAAEVFYVQDEIPAPARIPFSIQFGVPADAMAQEPEAGGLQRQYDAADGSYTIRTAILPGEDADEVMLELTGLQPETLSPIRTTRHGMQAYRFSWCSADEDGTRLCSAAILEDEDCCYCLSFTMPEDSAKQNRTLQMQVLDSFSLFEDEGF